MKNASNSQPYRQSILMTDKNIIGCDELYPLVIIKLATTSTFSFNTTGIVFSIVIYLTPSWVPIVSLEF